MQDRRLIADEKNVLDEITTSLTPGNRVLDVEIASKIRGYRRIKTWNIEAAKVCETELLAHLRLQRSPASEA